MHRISALAVSALLAIAGTTAAAADNAARVSASSSVAKPATAKKTSVRVATSRQELQSEAKGLALATETVEDISASQMDIAARVLTGKAECEFNESVSVEPVAEHPGHFRVAYKGNRYLMVPEETTTGAVRLVDKRAGVVWLQIPVKSMLMNHKIGQRMVDACMHAEQRVAARAVRTAGQKNSLE
jgi:hypothetical protein